MNNSIFHFVKMSEDEINAMHYKYASSHSKNYDSYIDNNTIKIYDKKKNIILEKKILDIDISTLNDEIKDHVIDAQKSHIIKQKK